ncbi:acetylcholinesterase-like isoform X2 [Haemaphysalis longicornis]
MLWKKWELHCWIVVAKITINVIFLPLLCAGAEDNDSLVVVTTNGSVRGFIRNHTFGKLVRVFYGIPYAQPPVGNLRFRKPVPKISWSGILDATIRPNSCVQALDCIYGNFNGSMMWNANTNMSEDCLKLNIWTPHPDPNNVAVLVWIYGGGFYSGTSTLDVYDATTLVARENVVVVSMNYRVASLGFLSFGNDMVPGNAGLYDQHLALGWIKENICAFGGDENRITIFGESAGAVSVGYHLLSPLSRRLFTRAILQSGYVTAPWGFQDNATARKSAKALAEALNCSTELDNSTLECLLKKDAKLIIENESEVWGSGVVEFPFVPVQDGLLIPNSTLDMSVVGTFNNETNVLLGSNANEGSYFLEYFLELPATADPVNITEQNFTAVIRALNPVKGEPPMKDILKMYGNVTNSSTEERLSVLDAIVGDYHFTCPVVQLADLLSQAKASVYQYFFSHRSSKNPWPKWMGVIHGEEIGFEFGEPFNASLKYEEVDKNLSDTIMQYWANFSKTGDPNRAIPEAVPNYVVWPRRDNKTKQYLVLNRNISVKQSYQTQKCAFWDSIREKWKRPEEEIRPATSKTKGADGDLKQ